jgi:DNA-binding transcriptional LysR family regulator
MAATDLHIRQIKHFLAIVEEGSFGKAAQKVHLSQPALSKSIRQLEDRLQVRLIDRTPKGIVATTFGEAFIDHARAIRAQINSAVAEMREMQGMRSGSVSVGVGPSLTSGIVPQAVARLARTRPDITVTITEELSHGITKGLLCGDFDFVVGAKLSTENADEIASEPLYVDRCVIVARPDHPITRMADVSLEQLREFGWILTGRAEALRTKFDDAFRRREVEPPEPQLRTNSVAFMRHILFGTDLLGFLPHALVREDEKAGRLVAVQHADCTWERTMYVAYRKHRSVSPLSRLLIRTIREISDEAAGEPAGLGADRAMAVVSA